MTDCSTLVDSALNPYANRLNASEWEVRSIPEHGQAVAFIREHHYAKGAPNTSTYRHGLYRQSDELVLDPQLVGVALWIPPTKAAAATVNDDPHAVLSLSRFAVHPDAPKNAASFLLGRSMKLIDRGRWPVLLTYADMLRGHLGGIYKATNWTKVGEVPAGDTWTAPDGSQCGRKRGQRTLTRAEMLASGCTPNPKAMKVKFVHRVGTAGREPHEDGGS